MLTPEQMLEAWKASTEQISAIANLVDRMGDILAQDAVSREMAAKMQHEQIARDRERSEEREKDRAMWIQVGKWVGAGLAALAAPLAAHLSGGL